jgi:hypothetical protein
MLVKFNGVWLTNDGSGTFPERAITSTQGATLSGKEVVQEVQFMRALASTFFDRGNLSHTFTFKVARNFQLLMPDEPNPIAQASAFMLTHFTLLAKSGALLMQCGGWGEAPLFAQASNAVLESTPNFTSRGVAVDATYSFKCGPIQLVLVDSPGSGASGGGGDPGGSTSTSGSGSTPGASFSYGPAITDPQGNPITDPQGNTITSP